MTVVIRFITSNSHDCTAKRVYHSERKRVGLVGLLRYIPIFIITMRSRWMCFPQLLKYQTLFLPHLPTICNLLHWIQFGPKSNLSAPNFKSVYSVLTIVQRTRLHPTILSILPLGLYIQLFGQVYHQPYMCIHVWNVLHHFLSNGGKELALQIMLAQFPPNFLSLTASKERLGRRTRLSLVPSPLLSFFLHAQGESGNKNIESLGSMVRRWEFNNVRQENGTGENRKKKEGKGKTVVGKRKK